MCVRKRPLTNAENRRGEADVVTAHDGDSVVVHESKEAVDLTQYILQVGTRSSRALHRLEFKVELLPMLVTLRPYPTVARFLNTLETQ